MAPEFIEGVGIPLRGMAPEFIEGVGIPLRGMAPEFIEGVGIPRQGLVQDSAPGRHLGPKPMILHRHIPAAAKLS